MIDILRFCMVRPIIQFIFCLMLILLQGLGHNTYKLCQINVMLNIILESTFSLTETVVSSWHSLPNCFVDWTL